MGHFVQLVLDLFDPAPAPAREIRTPSSPVAASPALPAATLNSVLTPVRFTHPRANRETRLCEAHVSYEFKRGRRRTIGMTISADGLVVSAPRWVTQTEVESALQKKAGWIVDKLGQMRERQQRLESARIEWRDGVSLPYLGMPVRVALHPEMAGALFLAEEGALNLGLPRTATPEQIRDSAQAWLMRQARALFTERLDHYAPQLGVQWRKLALSSADTRWGSASADGAIRLNWRLIHFRQAVIDYVVAHELSHLRVMNHSPHFWDTVGSVLPDYQSLRNELRDEAVPCWP